MVEPEEEPVYPAGPVAPSLVGYTDREAEVELACALHPPAHLEGYEVYDLFRLLQADVLPDGRPGHGVRVLSYDSSKSPQEIKECPVTSLHRPVRDS